MQFRSHFKCVVLAGLILAVPAFADTSALNAIRLPSHRNDSPDSDQNLLVIRTLLEQPEEQIDLTRAKLAIDRMVDPNVDVEKTVSEIDKIAATVASMLPPHPSAWESMLTMRQYLYIPGAWNRYSAYRYDFEGAGPTGTNIVDKLIPHYLATKKGQCTSMPLLYLFIAKRIGMNVAYAEAPAHSFVMLKSDDGEWLNLETTSEGNPTRLETYQRQEHMSKLALANGVYMRPLSNREAITAMAEELLQFYAEGNKPEKVIALADLLLKYRRTDVSALLFETNAFHRIIDRDFIKKYPNERDIPSEQIGRYHDLDRQYFKAERAAFALGFEPATNDDEQAYQMKLNQVKVDLLNKGKLQ